MAVIILLSVFLQNRIIVFSPVFYLKDDCISSQEFRALNFSGESLSIINETAKTYNIPFCEAMALILCDAGFDYDKINRIPEKKELKVLQFSYGKKQYPAYSMLLNACKAIFGDVIYFPVPECLNDPEKTVSFADSWMGERSFGGNRRHEGTDLMASCNERGVYPILSMTDGTVEKVGWLKLGGYRIGIRSESGGYFYYAHLAAYAKDFKEGDKVSAGDIIGFMGDSGYGAEGTVGEFDVHLHLGIYIDNASGQELAVNPYSVLRWIENTKKEMEY